MSIRKHINLFESWNIKDPKIIKQFLILANFTGVSPKYIDFVIWAREITNTRLKNKAIELKVDVNLLRLTVANYYFNMLSQDADDDEGDLYDEWQHEFEYGNNILVPRFYDVEYFPDEFYEFLRQKALDKTFAKNLTIKDRNNFHRSYEDIKQATRQAVKIYGKTGYNSLDLDSKAQLLSSILTVG